MRRALARRPPLLLLLVLGGSLLAGCGPQNVQACEEYVAALNTARQTCNLEPVVLEEQCPATLDHGADCTDYYLTLKNTVRCENGDILYGDGNYPYLAGAGCY